MNWINELCDLYDKNKDIAGQVLVKIYKNKKGEEEQTPLVLLPIFHTTVAAQITVTINERGELLQVESVQDEDKLTIIPTTEESAVRTSGMAPHPLCDNLKYLAGDYTNYCQDEKKKDTEKYTTYMKALKSWKESKHTHKKVNAIYLYLKKGTLIKDLVDRNILILDEKGKFLKNQKLQKIAQEDAFVRLRVESSDYIGEDILGDTTGKFCPECWLDRTLQQKYIQYYNSILKEYDICYLTGEKVAVSYLQPKKIRHEGDGTKLISSNDESNYTFRGRFETKKQAFAIGYETSQKVHNALKWIIRKQGSNWDGLCVAVWESDLKEIPDWSADTDSISTSYAEEFEGWEDDDNSEITDISESKYMGTNSSGADRFKSAILGYVRHLGNHSKTVLLSFDAATQGRLAMTEYKMLPSSRYLDNIKYWHESCEWIHTKYSDKHIYTYWGMVSMPDVAEILYGTEQNGIITLSSRMYAEVCKRLLPCITEKRKIPQDMVNVAVQKASSPVSYQKRYNWERVLSVACSLVKKQINECNKSEEEWTVALNKKSKDRNYLYGRLLAVADRVEYMTFDRERDNARETNAKRYMCSFSQHPFQMWKVIEEKLEPYFQKLKIGQRIYYHNLLEEICQNFDEETFMDNEKLNGLYLLGFHSQSYELKNNKIEENKGEDMKNESTEGKN